MNEDWREESERRIEERFAAGKHFKQVGEHSPDCWQTQHSSGLDPEAFIVHDGHESRDRIGRRMKSSWGNRWERYRCNDPHCDAVMLVRWDALARFVTSGAHGG